MTLATKIPNEVRVRLHEEADGRFWAEAIDLPGCYTQGATLDDALRNLGDAVLTYFEVPKSTAAATDFRYEGEARGKFILHGGAPA